MKLDVAIATWQPSGINRVEHMQLPVVPGVRYIVSWQEYGSNPVVPDSLATRPDVTVVLCEEPGVSRNRNNALRHSTADIVLMGDDDLTYYPHALLQIIDAFERDPEMDVATFRYDGEHSKPYPREKCSLNGRLPKNYWVSMIEIAVRRESLHGLELDPHFGPGAPVWQAAEDEKFLWDARHRGLRCRFIPLTIARHYGASTGLRVISSPGIAAGQGRIVRLEYPFSWPLRMLLKSFREWRKGGHPWFCLRHMLRGAFSSGA